jgi:nicotinate-nucleotide adenylyltransferase
VKAGIFGGTFNPIHNGHLRAAEEIRESFALDTIYFVPAFIPPHKKTKEIADAKDRIAMVRRAIKGNSLFTMSGIETQRGGISYSIDTLVTMEKKLNDMYYLIGIDAFLEIHTWHRYADLFSHTNFVVMIRPSPKRQSGLSMFPAKVRKEMTILEGGVFLHASGKKVYLHRVTQLDISATQIRESVKTGKSIRYLVPAAVEKYIKDKKLYQ